MENKRSSDDETKRGRNFVFETGARTALKLIASIGNLIVTGLLVKTLGQENFGLYRSATASVGMLSLAGAGMAGASFGLIVRHLSLGEYEAVNKVFSISVKYLWMVFVALTAFSFPLGWVLAKIYNIPAEHLHSFQLTSCFATIGMALGFAAMPFIWIIQARQQEYIINVLQIPFAIFTPFLIYFFAIKMPYAWSPSLALLIMIFLGNMLCICSSLWMHHRWLRFQWQSTHEEVGGRMKVSIYEQVAAVLLGQALVWSITFQCGVSILSQVVITMTFYAFSRDLIQTVSSTLVAPVGSLYHSEQYERASQAWYYAVNISTAVCLAVACTLAISNQHIISDWVGDKMFAGSRINYLLAFSLVVAGITAPTMGVLYAIDGYAERAWLLVLESLLSIGVAFILAGKMAALGGVLGITLAQCLSAVLYPWFANKRIKLPIMIVVKSLGRLFIVGILATVFVKNIDIGNLPHIKILFSDFINASLRGSLILIAIVFVGFNADIRNGLLLRIKFHFIK